jgi:4-hydroxy-3-methylbut-2-enyl diphosphate reductase
VDHLVRGAERERLTATGALVADMESAVLARAAAGRPLAVVRAAPDTPTARPRGAGRGLAAPLGAGRRVLAGPWAAAVAERWSAGCAPRSPARGSGAGRDRRAGPRNAAQIRKQIAHNPHVAGSRARGGVDEPASAPDGAACLSAHGVPRGPGRGRPPPPDHGGRPPPSWPASTPRRGSPGRYLVALIVSTRGRGWVPR